MTFQRGEGALFALGLGLLERRESRVDVVDVRVNVSGVNSSGGKEPVSDLAEELYVLAHPVSRGMLPWRVETRLEPPRVSGKPGDAAIHRAHGSRFFAIRPTAPLSANGARPYSTSVGTNSQQT